CLLHFLGGHLEDVELNIANKLVAIAMLIYLGVDFTVVHCDAANLAVCSLTNIGELIGQDVCCELSDPEFADERPSELRGLPSFRRKCNMPELPKAFLIH